MSAHKLFSIFLILIVPLATLAETTQTEPITRNLQPETTQSEPLDQNRLLSGSWTRVHSGCEEITPELARSITAQAGSENNWRRMSIQIDLARGHFDIISFDTTLCSSSSHCPPQGRNFGTVQSLGKNRLLLTSTSNTSNNPWGTHFRLWEFEIVEGVLVMKTTSSAPCLSGTAIIALVPTPMS